jgi:hypothetical protein
VAKTPAQKAADELLEEAVQKIVAAYPTVLPTESLIVDYTMVIEGMRFDDEGHSMTDIGLAFRGGQCRSTVVLGQLQLAADVVMDSFDTAED